MNEIKNHKRVLLKLSGEALLGPNKITPYDSATMLAIAEQIKIVHESGVEIAIVVGGGNIFRGARGVSEGMDQTLADQSGMLATVINGIALLDLLERKCGIPTRLISGIRVDQVAEPYIMRKAIRHLEKKRIIIFAGGTGNPFFTTDTAAALRASEIKASIVVKATDIDGIFDKDPKKHVNATLLPRVSYNYCIEKRLAVMDATAFTMCRERNIPIRVFSLFKQSNSIVEALTGKDIGSLVTDSDQD